MASGRSGIKNEEVKASIIVSGHGKNMTETNARSVSVPQVLNESEVPRIMV
jgi:hypothetical protein